MKTDLLKAIDAALAGQWEVSHQIVQQSESDPDAAWIHAVLHKIEGDLSNSQYWYRRAGRIEHADDHPQDELRFIRAELSS